MKILVTGGAGFIGSNLVDELIKSHDVVVLDNLTTGKKENINPKAIFIKGDIREERDVKKAMAGCSVVFHLAAQTDVMKSVENPDLDYQVNVVGSQVVFSAARNVGAKIIFTSSAAVYGDAKPPHNEDMECKPISDYGKNKSRAERLLKKDGNAFIARAFNCYGPDGNSVINTFCSQLRAGKEITIFGNGLQTRDFIYITDVVSALMLGLKKSGTYNIGSGSETSVLNLVDMIAAVSGKKPKMKFERPREGEIERSRADISKIKRLGWAPKVTLEEGVEKVWESV